MTKICIEVIMNRGWVDWQSNNSKLGGKATPAGSRSYELRWHIIRGDSIVEYVRLYRVLFTIVQRSGANTITIYVSESCDKMSKVGTRSLVAFVDHVMKLHG